jgi:hypothetical protein
MFSLFKRAPKEDWRLVKSYSAEITYRQADHKLYYHLFESNRKNRKVDIQCTFTVPSYMDLKDESKKITLYQEKIYRWEMGRRDPDIPTYDQIPEEETANFLKGKIS